jgi:AbrB family looped-hinge helix DNA binding protein
MRITSEGQITIPADLRERFGLLPDTEVDIRATSEGVLVKKVEESTGRGRALVEHMRGRATRRLTTDEIMSLTRGE